MKLFKYKEHNNTSNITYKYLMLSLFSVVICASLLCLTSYAWFTSTTVTSVSSVKAATYNLSYEIINDDETSTSISDPYRIGSNSVKFKLTASETSASTGYCVIKVGDNTYYTDQIIAGSSLSFTITGANGLEITFIPHWGTNNIDEEDKITNDSTITITSSASSNEPAAASVFEDDIDVDTNIETETIGEATSSYNNPSNESDNDSIENNSEESTDDINSGISTGDATNTDSDTSGDSSATEPSEEPIENNETKQSSDVSIEMDASNGE